MSFASVTGKCLPTVGALGERPQSDAPVYQAILWVVLIRAIPILFLLIFLKPNGRFGGKAAIHKKSPAFDRA